VPGDGAEGAASVTVSLEYVLAAAYGAILVRTHPDVRPRLAGAARTGLALALAFAAALVPPLAPIPAALVGTAVIAAAAPALRAVPYELLRVLRGGQPRV
jgi:hypothetical protein